MKKSMKVYLPVVVGFLFVVTSCKKCEECHYDGTNGEVDLGELCDDELEDAEANGYVVNDTTYEVHCHEH